MVWGWTFSFSFFLSPLGVWLSSCAVGLWKEPKHFKGKIQFLVKHWGCVCNQLNLFSFVAALAFSQQPLSLFPMGSITFAFCFNFPWTDSFWQGDPHLLLMKLCLSLLLFKHIFVFKFFFSLGMAWPVCEGYTPLWVVALAGSTNRMSCQMNPSSYYAMLTGGQ